MPIRMKGRDVDTRAVGASPTRSSFTRRASECTGGVHAIGPTLTSGQWYLVLTRIDIIESGLDQIDLWYFTADANVPTTVAGLGAPDLSSSLLDWGDSINTISVPPP